MNDLDKHASNLGATIRWLLTVAGTLLVAKGLVTNEQWLAISAAIPPLAALAWSLWQKQKQREAVAKALATPTK